MPGGGSRAGGWVRRRQVASAGHTDGRAVIIGCLLVFQQWYGCYIHDICEYGDVTAGKDGW